MTDDVLDIGLQFILLCRVFEDVLSGTLHPAGIVAMRIRLALLAGFGIWIPDAVEQHEHHADLVLISDTEKLIHSLLETSRIVLPGEVVQKHAHAGET